MKTSSLLFLLLLGPLFMRAGYHAGTPAVNNTTAQEAAAVDAEVMGDETMKDPVEILMQVDGIDEEEAGYILERLTEVVPEIRIVKAEKYSDAAGNGVQAESEAGETYNIYMYEDGVIYGIKEVSSGSYLYMVYE